jgi:hypothetical protein
VASILSSGRVALALLALAGAAAITFVAFDRGAPPPAGAGDAISVRQDPSAANLFLGGSELVVAERVEDVPGPYGLGSFDVRVNYNTAAVQAEFQQGPFLGSTGRQTYCQNSSGSGQAVLSCFSSGQTAGPTGDGIIAALIVQPAPGLSIRPAAGNGIEVILDNIAPQLSLKDISNIELAAGFVGDTRILVRALEADVNVDCAVDVIDTQLMAIRLGAETGSSLYSEQYDLEPAATPDGDIDGSDMQVVWGRTGSTCAAPNPSQPPPDKSTPTPSMTSPPTATPTCTDTDGDTLCNAQDADDDSDLCSDAAETGPNPALGGLRNPLSFWDFFDPSRDASVAGSDFFMLLARFGASGNPSINPLSPPAPAPAYHTRFDRGAVVGEDPWDLGPPNASISGTDFFAVLAQFGHSCA